MAKTTSKKSASKGSSSSGRGSSGGSRGGSKAASKSSSASRSGSKAAPKKAAAKKAAPKKAAAKAAPKKAAAKAASRSSANASRSSRSVSVQPINETGMFQELFLESLKDMYWAEKYLLKALPRMRKAATSSELQAAFEDHTVVTQQQVQRLEQVFEAIGKKAQGKKCEAMDGLVKEAEEIISDTQKGTKTRDVGLIIAAQKVEHYEIASYGSLATLAAVMGNEQVKQLLGQTLQEEKATDELLTQLAENNINEEAARNESAGGGSDDNDEEDGEGDDEEE